MAESKRADAEAKADLPVPPFDAEGYVAKELVNTRATIVLALYGLLLGQVSGLLVQFLDPSGRNMVPGVAVLLFGYVGIKGVLEVTGVAYQDWDRKTWAGHVLILFFTWLAAWILTMNAPFTS